MTLIEIMVASGLSVVVSMGIAGIYIFAIQQFTILVNMNTAQENVLWMAYHTKNVMSQAVNLVDPVSLNPPSPKCVVSVGAINGCIPDFTTTTNTGGAAVISNVASFQREWSTGFNAAGVSIPSELLPTTIFLELPRPNTEGRIYFDLNTTPGTVMTAGLDDISYGQVVKYDLRVNVESIYGTFQFTGVDVDMATRYHRSSSDNKRWCVPLPNDATGGCIDGVASSDVSMRFSVGLRNNKALVKTAAGQSRSIHGGVYYYRFIPPIFTDVQ
ncbi:MAG: hypothetical protein KDD37_04800 [Bdellovibrionales bacterium]|nr:hypothetical protein [Bdellovibrionales bacterium]